MSIYLLLFCAAHIETQSSSFLKVDITKMVNGSFMILDLSWENHIVVYLQEIILLRRDKQIKMLISLPYSSLKAFVLPPPPFHS